MTEETAATEAKPARRSRAKKPEAPPSFTVKMTLDRETKNYVRFVDTENDPELFGKQYVHRDVWDSLGQPESLTVHLTPGE